MKKRTLTAIGLAASTVIPLLSAAPVWAFEVRTMNVSCGVNMRLNVVSYAML